MNRQAFFAALRARDSGVFGTSLSQTQIDGIEGVLAAGAGMPISHIAYALATAYHETGGRMAAITENMNYTSAKRLMQVWPSRFKSEAQAAPYVRNPEKLANLVYGGRLGNTALGDGWKYRGRGLVQLTGKVNYEKIMAVTGVDVVSDPDRALNPTVSALALIQGIRAGIYTGKKASDYLPGDYVNARRIINADVGLNGAKIALQAQAFEAALQAAGYAAAPQPRQPVITPPIAPAPASGWAGFWAALAALFGKGKP
jgi:putative chitinase